MMSPRPPEFTIMDRNALDRLDRPCCFCKARITHKEAPTAVEVESLTTGRTGYAHLRCGLRHGEQMLVEGK